MKIFAVLPAALLCSIVDVPGADQQPGLVRCASGQEAPGGAATPQGAAATPQGVRAPHLDPTSRAKQHYEKGAANFQRGNYLGARVEFEVAYELSKQPLLLYNLGKTAEKLNQTADAIRFYDGFLLSDPPAADAEEVRARMAELDKRMAAEKAQPTQQPAQQSTQQPTQQPNEQPKESLASKLPPIPALALLGAGTGLLIIGIGCGGGALSDANTVRNAGTAKPPVAYSTVVATDSQGRTLNGAGIAFDVLGALALGAGGAWTGYWLYQRNKSKNQPAPAVSLVPVHLGMGLAGSF